ncbi:PASTA domain-containing protein [Frankia sp. AgB1.9]|uniref:PASTA domain-containing protein n=1 Tax=unclassified Frankia TaxID=2632575 RepID=UPI001931FFF7|nr:MULTISPECIES: PASTA domain-containing protein [unclassified Frankia]MBL7492416.1 PASTA domain-containing protein [Frankia sp. AgW1.1]MBL7549392.1 PASTA domain-containing protein [Frankia sp. AgB1.9]MBL7624860.1 PASTA domain-containing protein [Frankia sp. AgB1.8]
MARDWAAGDKDGPWPEGRRVWERLEHWRDRRGRAADADLGNAALDALSDVGTLRRLLDQAELTAVRTARGQRRSWAEIATRLGVTRQSAWERWRDLDEDLPEWTPPPDDDVETALLNDAARAEIARRARELAEQSLRDDAAEAFGGPRPLPSGAAGEDPSGPATKRRGRRYRTSTVPDVVTLPIDEARRKLAESGFVGVAVGLGDGPGAPLVAITPEPGAVVSSQAPEAGARVDAGATVRLWVRPGGGSAGVREPRRPFPAAPPARALRLEPGTGDAVASAVE